jgi:hypothetical protein
MNYRCPNGAALPAGGDVPQRTMAEIFGDANSMNLEIEDDGFTPKQERDVMKADLLAKFYRADWHGVSDAANDLRVLEAQHPELKA